MTARAQSVLRAGAGRAAAVAIAVLALAVIAALAALWPHAEATTPSPWGAGPIERAQVLTVTAEGCERFAGPGCRLVHVRLDSGPNADARSFLTLPAGGFGPDLEPDDRIRVSQAPQGEAENTGVAPLSFVDFERSLALVALAVAFGLVVVALARWQGLRSLVSLGTSLALVLGFVVPAILEGRPPLLVALVGALAVMLVTMTLTHGIGLKSAAAMLGTTAALLLTALIAVLAVKVARITGLSSEQSVLLIGTSRSDISVQGLVLAGIVIGALGVLDDVTISQASTVLALRRTNRQLPFRRLFTEAMAVGRDHLGATVNTLALAYAGAALPVLLIFANQQTSFAEAVNSEPVAQEIVATLVGSLGLIAAVPLTTALAAALVTRLPADSLPADEHGHRH